MIQSALIETITLILEEHLPDECRELIKENPDGLLLLLYPEARRVEIDDSLMAVKWRIAIEDLS